MAWFTQDEVLKPIKNIQTDTGVDFFHPANDFESNKASHL